MFSRIVLKKDEKKIPDVKKEDKNTIDIKKGELKNDDKKETKIEGKFDIKTNVKTIETNNTAPKTENLTKPGGLKGLFANKKPIVISNNNVLKK